MAEDIRNDAELWELVRQHDRPAFEVLYRRYIGILFAEINKRISNRQEAEDITQEIFLSLWQKRDTLVLEGRLFSYLYKMAQNQVFRHFRNKQVPVDYQEVWDNLTDNTQAFREAELKNLELLVEAARQQLPPKMRAVYELRYEQQMSPVEISEKLIISPNTVRNHLKEVRKRLISAARKTSFFLFSLL